jgi:hypothetical protein
MRFMLQELLIGDVVNTESFALNTAVFHLCRIALTTKNDKIGTMPGNGTQQ